FDLHSLNAAIGPLLEAHNRRKQQVKEVSREELFLEHEKPLLSPLPTQPFILLVHKSATVQKNYHVFLSEDRHYYSVPYQLIGKKVDVRYNEISVEVYHQSKRIASHIRSRKSGGYTTHIGHMPDNHRFMQECSIESFLCWGKS